MWGSSHLGPVWVHERVKHLAEGGLGLAHRHSRLKDIVEGVRNGAAQLVLVCVVADPNLELHTAQHSTAHHSSICWQRPD
jgi:hypothetical protein